MNDIPQKIEKLQMEIKAMQADPLLQEDYARKVLKLIKLRRSAIRRAKKDRA